MAIFSNTHYMTENVNCDNIEPSMECASRILYEMNSDIYKLISATYVADVMIESAVSEGATNVEALIEKTGSEFKNKVKEKFKAARVKIAAWFKRMIDKIRTFFMGADTFIKKYEDQVVENFAKLKDKPKYEGYDYMSIKDIRTKSDAIINSFAKLLDETKDVTDDTTANLIEDKYKKALETNGAKSKSISELKESLKKMYQGNTTSTKNITVSDVGPYIQTLKDQKDIVSGINDLAKEVDGQFNDIINDLDSTKEGNIAIISTKSNLYKKCVNAIDSVATTSVTTINTIVSVYLSVLKKIAVAKPKAMNESYGGETGSIFESALSML